jgi:regulatory protein
MNRVTALVEHARRAGRYLVAVDGEALGAVSGEVVAALRLVVGGELTEDAMTRLAVAVRATACYDRAVDALARRSRSRVELGRWLRARGYGAEEVEPVLEKLEGLALLDDRAFARGFARTRLAGAGGGGGAGSSGSSGGGRGYGSRRVAAELAQRGVAREVIAEVLAELQEEEGHDEGAEVLAVAERKLRGMRGLDRDTQRRRLYAFLARRGFGAGAIRTVMDHVFGSSHS